MDLVRAIGIYGDSKGAEISSVLTDGNKLVDTASLFLPYPQDMQQRLMRVRNSGVLDRSAIRALVDEVSDWFVQASRLLIERTKQPPAIVGLYGQPIILNNEICHLGSSRMLASKLGASVVYDFHRTDALAGGNGCFLHAPYYRAIINRAVDLGYIESQPTIAIINVSDVSRITVLPTDCDPIMFDAGPGLALVDEFTQIVFQRNDVYGDIATKGDVCGNLLFQIEREFYRIPRPTEVCDLKKFLSYVRLLNKDQPLDWVATLTTFIVHLIERALMPYPGVTLAVLVGRGQNNSFLKTLLASSFRLTTPTHLSWESQFEISEQAAFNAVRRLHSLVISYPTTTGTSLVCGRVKRIKPPLEKIGQNSATQFSSLRMQE
jgi:anhydro-N-acetylmuramic acid kinase